MGYIIKGLPPIDFDWLKELDDSQLAKAGARRVIADSCPGFPCRISLEDAAIGESLLLLNHVSHDVHGPFRTSHAIYIRPDIRHSACYINSTPPVFAGRTLSLRGFDRNAMLHAACLAAPGQADKAIRDLLDNADIAYIDAHNAAPGCFAARVVRKENI